MFENPFEFKTTEGGVFVNEFGEKMVEIPNRGQGFQWLLLNKRGNAQLLHKGEWISYEGLLETLRVEVGG